MWRFTLSLFNRFLRIELHRPCTHEAWAVCLWRALGLGCSATGVFNGSVAPPGYGLTCPQDSTIGYYPGMRCNKVLTLSTNAYSNIPITFHVHNPTTLLVLYRLYRDPTSGLRPFAALFTSSSLTSPLACPSPWLPPPPDPSPAPPIPIPTQGRPPSKPFVVARRGRPSVRVLTRLSATLPSRSLPPSHPSLCNDIL